MIEGTYAVALVGSPNSGKTTLFNWLTGSKFKTVNYPGATVEYTIGLTHGRYGEKIQVMDTPGTYSLLPRSPDEKIAVESIFNHQSMGASPLVISVVDSTQFTRHLLITKQLLKSGFNVIVALTMTDLLHAKGEIIDTLKLSELLGVPVVEIDGKLGGGVTDLIDQLRKKLESLAKPIRPYLVWENADTELAFQDAVSIEKQVFKKHRKK